VWDYFDRWQEFLDEVSPLVARGEIQFEETEMRGFDKLPEALAGLFKGVNTGKVRLQEHRILAHSTRS
jgi:NADPH-dependent curcumin reductase CurA